MNANQSLRSGLHCGKCDRNIGECICPDCDARLKDAARSGKFAAKWCVACDRYWARCFCAEPKYRLVVAGKQEDPSTVTDGYGRPLTETHPEIGYDGPEWRLP